MDLSFAFVPVVVTPKTTWLFVSLSDGEHTGWGEATLAGQEHAVAAKAAALPSTTTASGLGSLPFDTLPDAALSSALQQAHTDLSARQAGLRASEYLGRSARERIGVYANINRRTRDRSPQGMGASAAEAIARGHEAIKIAPFDEVCPAQGAAEMALAMEQGLARIDAVRSVIGDRRLMVDCHWRFDASGAEALIDACASFDLYWIECPIPETEAAIPTLKTLRGRANATGTRLAGLETAILRDGFALYVDAGVYDVMMPDVKYCGGPKEMLAISEQMARSGVDFSPHNPSGPICHAQSLHVCATLPHGDLLETQFDETPLFDSLVSNAVPQVRDGAVTLSESASGIGVALTPPYDGIDP